MQLTFKKNQKFYWFIIAYLSLEIFFKITLNFFEMGSFTMAPYLRLCLIFFTLLFFCSDILRLKIPINKTISKASYQNIFVFGWFIFALISILIGLINKNPTLYVITDFIYVFLGTLLFYITDRNNKHYITFNFFNRFSRILIIISLFCFITKINPPALLLILMIISVYINILKKRFMLALFLLIPYFILVVSTNRAQLVIFCLMVFILFLKKNKHYFTTKSVIFIGGAILFLLYFIKQQVLDTVLLFVNQNNSIGLRLKQISVILKEGIDYSNPYFTSISQRIIEAQIVINNWTANIINFLFGLGSGATIDGSKFFKDNSVLNSALLGATKIHNIHLLPFSLIFRYGIIGLFLFIHLSVIIYKSFIKVLNEDDDFQKIFWNLFLIFWFFFSIPASSFLWSMPLFWIGLSMIKKGDAI